MNKELTVVEILALIEYYGKIESKRRGVCSTPIEDEARVRLKILKSKLDEIFQSSEA